jgi:hypothetical protein
MLRRAARSRAHLRRHKLWPLEISQICVDNKPSLSEFARNRLSTVSNRCA